MLLAIISDSHDNEPNIRAVLSFLRTQQVSAIIHCGDICAPETLELFAKEFSNPIHVVYGNIDYDTAGLDAVVARYPHLHGYGETGALKLGDVSVAFTHYPKAARQLATDNFSPYGGSPEGRQLSLIFYGHTHKPWEETIGSCRLLNPGTLAGMWYKATFALVDLQTGKATLKLVEQLRQ